MATELGETKQQGVAESKGLKDGAIGLASATVIGVASTAPGYSLAATIGFIAVYVGIKSPAIIWISFIPIAFIAAAFYYLNKADPDCGTNFTWVTRSFGPRWGWMGGWSSMIADLVIMPNLAQIAASYTFLLFGKDNWSTNVWATMALGIVFIMAMTWICVVGIELSARTQMALLCLELAILVLFSVVALVHVYGGHIHGSIHPAFSWLLPTHMGGFRNLVEGVLLAVFIYWGWDTATSVNEESENANTTPGVAGVLSTIILVAIFLIVTICAQAVKGATFLSNSPDDVLSTTGKVVFGSSTLGTIGLKLLIIAILSSAVASCQTTILPAARTTLSMAMHRAFPAKLGEVDPKHLTPAFSTWLFGGISSLWYVGLVLVGRATHGDILGWSVLGVGLMIAYYYGQCGIACAWYYRKYLRRSIKDFVLVGLFPLVGGLILLFVFGWAVHDMFNPGQEGTPSWLGVSPILWLSGGPLVLGIPLMMWWNTKDHAFFRVKPDPIDRRPPPEGGDQLPPLVDSQGAALMAGEVVLGYDGREGAQAALETAAAIAAVFKRPLVIVFGYAPVAMGGETGDLARAVKELGETMTTEAVAAVKAIDATVEVKVELVDDRPAESVLRAADEYDAMAVVVGGTNQGPIRGSLLGSVTYQVVHRSTRPVVVVPFVSEDAEE